MYCNLLLNPIMVWSTTYDDDDNDCFFSMLPRCCNTVGGKERFCTSLLYCFWNCMTSEPFLVTTKFAKVNLNLLYTSSCTCRLLFAPERTFNNTFAIFSGKLNNVSKFLFAPTFPIRKVIHALAYFLVVCHTLFKMVELTNRQ